MRDKGGLTIHDDLDDPKINLAAGHEAPLTCVRALIGLLYATNLEVIVVQHLKPNWKEAEDRLHVGCVTFLTTVKSCAHPAKY